MGTGQHVMAAPAHRQEAEPGLYMLSLMETPVMGGQLRPDLVKPHKAAPWTLGVETGSAVDQGCALAGH